MTLLKAFEQGNGSEQYCASRRLICCISKVVEKQGDFLGESYAWN